MFLSTFELILGSASSSDTRALPFPWWIVTYKITFLQIQSLYLVPRHNIQFSGFWSFSALPWGRVYYLTEEGYHWCQSDSLWQGLQLQASMGIGFLTSYLSLFSLWLQKGEAQEWLCKGGRAKSNVSSELALRAHRGPVLLHKGVERYCITWCNKFL